MNFSITALNMLIIDLMEQLFAVCIAFPRMYSYEYFFGRVK